MSDYEPSISVTGRGPTVVLVPGMDGTGALFYRQVPLLSCAYRVVTYRLRSDARTMADLVADLASVIETAEPFTRRAVVVGESFGGALAISLALARPDRVASLLVLNSFPYFAPQMRLWLARMGLAALPWGMMPLVRRLTAWRLRSPHTYPYEIRQFLTLTAEASRAGYLNRLRLLRHYDVRERLRDLRVPAMFVAAERDRLVPAVAQARLMADRAPRSTLRILEGHGHLSLSAADVDLGDLLREFMAHT